MKWGLPEVTLVKLFSGQVGKGREKTCNRNKESKESAEWKSCPLPCIVLHFTLYQLCIPSLPQGLVLLPKLLGEGVQPVNP